MAIAKIIKLKNNKSIEIGLKIIITFWAVWYLANSKTINFYPQDNLSSYILILYIFSVFNWFFEIKKWQFLSEKITKTNFYTAFKQSLISFSFSLLTPNRIGEYGAKITFFDKKNYKKILSLNFIGNTSQLLITLLLGILSLLFLRFHKTDFIPFNKKNYIFYALIIALNIILLSYLYKKIIKNKYTSNISIWKKCLGYSFLRYFSFSMQFFLFYKYLHQTTPTEKILIAIGLTYILSTIIPVLAFMDWAIKSTSAVFIFNWLELPTKSLTTIISIMWIYNFLIPFLIGLVLFWLTNFNKK